MKEQPAYKSYVFDKAYRDVKATFATTWKNTLLPIQKESRNIARIFSRGRILIGIFIAVADLVVFGAITLFRVTLNSIISLLLLTVFVLAAAVVYAAFGFVCLLDWLYRVTHKISSKCPNCQHKFKLPVYECPKCNRKHTELIPSVYGIFKRKCLCGNKLPTTFFNGRHKLPAKCPDCGFVVRDGGRHVDVCVPVIGGPHAGKTCFVYMAISELQKLAPKEGMTFEYVFNGLNNYKPEIEALRNGRLPPKTSEMRLKYFPFYLTPKKKRVKRLISLCDVGGEVYRNRQMLGTQIGFRYANAFIIVIDPMSVREYKAEFDRRYKLSGFAASTEPIDEILSRVVSTLESMYAMSSKKLTKKLFKTNVAVVFTKCDIPGLDEKIGRRAIDARVRTKHITREQATNQLCEEFLCKYGEANFVNSIKSKFRTVQYFTCSALGYNKNLGQYIPDGVDAPVVWIYKKLFGR